MCSLIRDGLFLGNNPIRNQRLLLLFFAIQELLIAFSTAKISLKLRPWYLQKISRLGVDDASHATHRPQDLGIELILLFAQCVIPCPEPSSFKNNQPCGHSPRICSTFNLLDRFHLGFDAKYRLLDSRRVDSLT